MTSRRRFLKDTAFSLLGASLYGGCTSRGSAGTGQKVIVLGFDGMDPVILARLTREGKLPHFAQLLERGNFRPLGTTVPPLSPVAWATFTTGMNPGGHGIYDFVHRDAGTMTAYLSTTRAEGPSRTIQLGNWVIPLSAGKISLLREGRAFWEVLHERGVPTTVMRAPANFPPVPDAGRQLSGMGTPDIQGTYGVYSFFTTDDAFKASGESGGEVFHVKMVDRQVQARLFGPRNTFRADAPSTAVGFTVAVDATNPVAKVMLQDQDVLLRVGEWSPWLSIRFDMVPHLQSVDGIVRFYLKETHPHLKLYATPVNLDPANPALPISTPGSYAHELAHELGPFYTQGMPHDTKALSNGVLDDEEFLSQAALVLEEHTRLFDFELDRFRSGFLFLYTDRVDQVGHMFWGPMDPDHPVTTRRAYAGVIEQTYRDMDGLVGKAMKRVDGSTTLLVMSDHGFAPFYRAFNLNTWLRQGGYLKVSPRGEGKTPLEEIDWDATRAYGVGLQGLYVNARGRERFGIVRDGADHDRLVDEIAAGLLQVRDPRSGHKVVERVYKARETFRGAALGQAPDIVVGYARGYRVAWDSVLGRAAEDALADNTDKWSGDHSMAAELVPGILLANRTLGSTSPGLVDLGPSIVELFGLASVTGMEGRSVFAGGGRA